MLKSLETLVAALSEFLWGKPMVLSLVFVGLSMAVCTDFVQLRHMGLAFRVVLRGIFSKSGKGKNTVSPFEAMCTALAGTIGTGNIAGVMIALTLGGAGAVFWMWVSALLGMGIKYAEIVLAVKYREKSGEGYIGGPMYYIKNGLGKKFNWLATAFCIFGAAAAFGIGNMMQVGSIMTTLDDAATLFLPKLSDSAAIKLAVGAIIAILCWLTAAGGAKGRGKAVSFVVPFMALFYIFGSLCVIGANIERLPEVLCSIISGAFSNRAIIGGAGAYTAKEALSAGFKRGMLSNEAGLGSAPMAHGSADCESPVLQGFYGIFEVFFDTIVICTLTAVTVLISGVPISYGTLGGAEYCTWALSSVFGDRLSALFMCVTITLFAFSSIISWSLYGERCIEFLIGKNAVGTYRLAFSAVTLLSSVMSFSLIVRLSDVMNALMAIPNLVALLLLMPAVRDETRRYFSAKK